MINLFLRHLWVMLVLGNTLGIALQWWWANRRLRQDPKAQARVAAMAKRSLIVTCIPWVVMGIGATVGGIPSFFEFLRPRVGNIYVLAFYASIVAVWALTSWWLVFRDGATQVVACKGFFSFDFSSPLQIYLLLAISTVWMCMMMVILFLVDVPTPQDGP